MSELDLNEIANLQKTLFAMKPTYEGLSDCMLNKLLMLKDLHPKTIRIAFSRQPKVKEINGIARKISILRAAGKKSGIRDVTDVIALTILCPYESDVSQIHEWVKSAFDISPRLEEAARDAPDGHRGYHFVLQLQRRETRTFPDYRGLCCELQIKTLLQEAFDAKSHDLAYKPPNAEVGDELKRQFFHLSTHLRAIDGQSEFLKDLILREKKEVELRRRACLQVYVSDCGDIPAILGINPEKLPDLATTIEILDNPDLVPSKDLCKFVAYCATTFENDYLKKLALDLIERYVECNPQDSRRLFGRGSLYWALGMHEQALSDMQTIIAETEGEANTSVLKMNREAKNNFIYFTCDWQIFSSGASSSYIAQAAGFVECLSPEKRVEELDTIGLYKIIFSKSIDEIDQGRRQLTESFFSRKNNQEIYQKFYELHQFIAINRMMKLMTKAAQ